MSVPHTLSPQRHNGVNARVRRRKIGVRNSPLKRVSGLMTRELTVSRAVTDANSQRQLWDLPAHATGLAVLGYDMHKDLMDVVASLLTEYPPPDYLKGLPFQRGQFVDEEKIRARLLQVCGTEGKTLVCARNLLATYEKFETMEQLCASLKKEFQYLSIEQSELDQTNDILGQVKTKLNPTFNVDEHVNVARKILSPQYFQKLKTDPNVKQGPEDVVKTTMDRFQELERRNAAEVCKHQVPWTFKARAHPGVVNYRNAQCDPYTHTDEAALKKAQHDIEVANKPPFYPTRAGLDNHLEHTMATMRRQVSDILFNVSEEAKQVLKLKTKDEKFSLPLLGKTYDETAFDDMGPEAAKYHRNAVHKLRQAKQGKANNMTWDEFNQRDGFQYPADRFASLQNTETNIIKAQLKLSERERRQKLIQTKKSSSTISVLQSSSSGQWDSAKVHPRKHTRNHSVNYSDMSDSDGSEDRYKKMARFPMQAMSSIERSASVPTLKKATISSSIYMHKARRDSSGYFVEKARVHNSKETLPQDEHVALQRARNLTKLKQADAEQLEFCVEQTVKLFPSTEPEQARLALEIPNSIKFSVKEQRTMFPKVGDRMVGHDTARGIVEKLYATSDTGALAPLPPPNSLSLPPHPTIIPDKNAPPYAFRSKRPLEEELKVKMFKLDWHAMKPRIKLLCERHFPAKDDKFKQIFWVFYNTLRSLFLSLACQTPNHNKVDSHTVMSFFKHPAMWGEEKDHGNHHSKYATEEKQLTDANVTKLFFESLESKAMDGLDDFDEQDVPAIPEHTWTRAEFFDLLLRFALLKLSLKKFSGYDEAEKLHFLMETCVLRALPAFNNVHVFQWLSVSGAQKAIAEHAPVLYATFQSYADSTVTRKDAKLTEDQFLQMCRELQMCNDEEFKLLKPCFYVSLDENETAPVMSYSAFLEFLGRLTCIKMTSAKASGGMLAHGKQQQQQAKRRSTIVKSNANTNKQSGASKVNTFVATLGSICDLIDKNATTA